MHPSDRVLVLCTVLCSIVTRPHLAQLCWMPLPVACGSGDTAKTLPPWGDGQLCFDNPKDTRSFSFSDWGALSFKANKVKTKTFRLPRDKLVTAHQASARRSFSHGKKKCWHAFHGYLSRVCLGYVKEKSFLWKGVSKVLVWLSSVLDKSATTQVMLTH